MKKRILAIVVCLAMVFTTYGYIGIDYGVGTASATTEIPACNCNNDNADMISHSDGCAEKVFYMNLCKKDSAKEIYKNWSDYPSDAQEYILAYLSWTNQGKLHELRELIKEGDGSELPSTSVVKNGTATVGTETGEVITVEGNIPKGTTVKAESISEKKHHEDLVMYTEGEAPIFAVDLSFKGADGSTWQPSKGDNVEVRVSADYEDGTKIGIMHVHEGTAESLGLYGDWKVQDGELAFETDAFSEFYGYIVDQSEFVRNPGKVFANAAPIIKEKIEDVVEVAETFSLFKMFSLGRTSETQSREVITVDETNDESDVVLNKTVASTGTAGNESFKLTLDTYATGSEGTMQQIPVPNDIVLVLDESGSMDDCIECNHEIDHGRKPVENVTSKGNVTSSSKENNTVLFRGHVVFDSDGDIWKSQKYVVVYPADGTTRTIEYCDRCDGWFSEGSTHNEHTSHKKAEWIPFTKSDYEKGTTPSITGKSGGSEWTCKVKFYCVCDHDTSRVTALKQALLGSEKKSNGDYIGSGGFINQLYLDSIGEDGIAGTADDVANRLAIVGFGNDTPSKIYSVDGTDDNTDSSANAKKAYKNVTIGSQKQILIDAINDLKYNEATATYRGVEAAENILKENPVSANEDRNRVVILFTDGAPGSSYNNYGPNTGRKDWTNPAIRSAYNIKNTYNATVYTVGLFPGADATKKANTLTYDPEANGQHNPGFFDNANLILQLISSNYLNAKSVTDKGSINPDLGEKGYYLSTENEDGLYKIFDALSNVVKPGSTTVTLDEKTVLKDIVTPYFEIPEGADGKARVTAYTEDFIGVNADGSKKWGRKSPVSIPDDSSSPLKVVVNGRTVTVEGFDFAENYVGINKDENNNDVYRGKRLVVEIEIIPTEDFLGGDDVDTNDRQSGLYVDDKVVEKFPVPNVDVKVKTIIPTILAKDIYLSQAAKLPEILNIGNFKANGKTYTVNNINNDYVDIKYTLTDPNTNKTIVCTIPAGESDPDAFIWEVDSGLTKEPVLENDTTYEVLCEVTSINAEGKHSESTNYATVNVYKPVVTFKDSILDLGKTANYATDNYVDVKWMHGETEASTLGPAPILVYTYDPAEGAFIVDTPVKVLAVTAKAGGAVPADKDIISDTTFYREACDFNRCTHTSKTLVNKADPNFIVHPNNFDLVLTKAGISAIDHHGDVTGAFNQIISKQEKQTTIYEITGPNNYSAQVAICGNDSITLEGLAAGEYTIRELDDWSWRYDVESVQHNSETPLISSNQLTFISENPVENVKFTNTRNNIFWLNGGAYCKNVFGIRGNN